MGVVTTPGVTRLGVSVVAVTKDGVSVVAREEALDVTVAMIVGVTETLLERKLLVFSL